MGLAAAEIGYLSEATVAAWTQICTISPAFAGISLHVTEAWQYLAALQQSNTAASAINTDVYTATACQFEGNLMKMVQTGQLAVVSQTFYIYIYSRYSSSVVH